MKKNASPPRVALTHFLFGGLLPGMVVTWVTTPVTKILISPDTDFFAYFFVSLAISVAVLYFGITYSARRIRRIYVIDNAKKVVRLSTVYYLLVQLLVGVPAILVSIVIIPPLAVLALIAIVVQLLLFYFLSRRLIKVDMAAPAPQTS